MEFVKGLFVNQPDEKTPDFVKAKLSIKAEEFKQYLDEKVNDKGYVNVDILVSKAGKVYPKLNEWKPTAEGTQDTETMLWSR